MLACLFPPANDDPVETVQKEIREQFGLLQAYADIQKREEAALVHRISGLHPINEKGLLTALQGRRVRLDALQKVVSDRMLLLEEMNAKITTALNQAIEVTALENGLAALKKFRETDLPNLRISVLEGNTTYVDLLDLLPKCPTHDPSLATRLPATPTHDPRHRVQTRV